MKPTRFTLDPRHVLATAEPFRPKLHKSISESRLRQGGLGIVAICCSKALEFQIPHRNSFMIARLNLCTFSACCCTSAGSLLIT